MILKLICKQKHMRIDKKMFSKEKWEKTSWTKENTAQSYSSETVWYIGLPHWEEKGELQN